MYTPETVAVQHSTKKAVVRIIYRKPQGRDGGSMWSLAKDSAGLDVNSPYAYLLFSEYFPDTCLVAEDDDGPCGFVMGFRPPEQPETLFVWQITVAPGHRGRGIGVEMLASLVGRLADAGVTHVEATVTPSNMASRKMFQALARRFAAPYDEDGTPLFSQDMFPGGEQHEEERRLRIGPIDTKAAKRSSVASPTTA